MKVYSGTAYTANKYYGGGANRHTKTGLFKYHDFNEPITGSCCKRLNGQTIQYNTIAKGDKLQLSFMLCYYLKGSCKIFWYVSGCQFSGEEKRWLYEQVLLGIYNEMSRRRSNVHK